MRGDAMEFEAAVRRAFTRLVRQDLPRAAVERGWPVRTAEEFERLLLGHLQEADQPVGTPCLFDLVLAVELGDRMLAGTACCSKMDRRRRCTDSADPARLAAWNALLDALDAERHDRGGH